MANAVAAIMAAPSVCFVSLPFSLASSDECFRNSRARSKAMGVAAKSRGLARHYGSPGGWLARLYEYSSVRIPTGKPGWIGGNPS